MPSSAVYVVPLVVTLIVSLLYFAETFTRDRREPVYVTSKIPIIGHGIGFLRWGQRYLNERVRLPPSTPIFTVPIANLKLYIINSSELLPVIQRFAKTVNFAPFQRVLSEKWGFVSKECLQIVKQGVGEAEPPSRVIEDDGAIIRNALLPGPHLDEMNVSMANTALRCIEKIADEGVGERRNVRKLYACLKDIVMLASTDSLWGPHNPLQHEELQQAYWDFEEDGGKLLIALFPSLQAKKGLKGFNKLWPAFHKFIESGQSEQASFMIRERLRSFREYGIKDVDIARVFVILNFGALSNSVPAAFWTIFEIFSDPDLLQQVRSELEEFAVLKSEGDAGAAPTFTIDIASIKSRCHLLLSVFQENMRTKSQHMLIRKVMMDTALSTGNTLKQGNYIMTPVRPFHQRTALWGNDSLKYDPHRFIKDQMDFKVRPAAFLGWGTAPHICPARQFATTEIILVAAALVLRFDLEPTSALGWERKELFADGMSTMWPPKEDTELLFKAREGWQGTWEAKLGQSKSKFPLAVG